MGVISVPDKLFNTAIMQAGFKEQESRIDSCGALQDGQQTGEGDKR